MAPLRLRPATIDDARQIWDWRNDPVAREASRQTAPIAWNDHAAWFATAIGSRIIAVGEVDNVPVGMARLDPSEAGWRVSINLAPEARGKGLGQQLLAAALSLAPGPFLAEIRHGNAASERIFLRCGFVKTGDEDGFAQFGRA